MEQIRTIRRGVDPTDSQRDALLQLLHEFEGSFQFKGRKFGFTDLVKHHIRIGMVAPIKQRAYRLSQREKRVIKQAVSEMLLDDVIELGSGPWASGASRRLREQVPHPSETELLRNRRRVPGHPLGGQVLPPLSPRHHVYPHHRSQRPPLADDKPRTQLSPYAVVAEVPRIQLRHPLPPRGQHTDMDALSHIPRSPDSADVPLSKFCVHTTKVAVDFDLRLEENREALQEAAPTEEEVIDWRRCLSCYILSSALWLVGYIAPTCLQP
jgi:hypothetical protein